MNEAALLAARHGKKKIDMEELDEAIDRVIAGPERKSRLISDEEKRIIAYHEAGHALGRPRAAQHRPDPQDLDHRRAGRRSATRWRCPTEDKFLTHARARCSTRSR